MRIELIEFVSVPLNKEELKEFLRGAPFFGTCMHRRVNALREQLLWRVYRFATADPTVLPPGTCCVCQPAKRWGKDQESILPVVFAVSFVIVRPCSTLFFPSWKASM